MLKLTNEIALSDLPPECIRDCSAAGQVSGAVDYWRKRLGLLMPRREAQAALARTGAWSVADLVACDNGTIAARILWLACCDFAEFIAWRESNPSKPEHECPSGAPVFFIGG